MHRSSRGSRRSTTERLIGEAGNWPSWDRLVASKDAAQQGAAFERLTQLLLQTQPEYQSKLKHVWLLSEVPEKVRAKLRLPQLDEGIDLVAETHEGAFWAIQSKFRSDREGTLTRKKLDTFKSLAFVACTGISLAVTGGEKREDVNGAPKDRPPLLLLSGAQPRLHQRHHDPVYLFAGAAVGCRPRSLQAVSRLHFVRVINP